MHGILKKKFSQNFLIDKNILNKISCLISKKNLNIVEIGPGNGALTEYILNFQPSKLTLIEIDQSLISTLQSKFKYHKNIKIINEDFLKYKVEGKIELIISNLPYNVSSQILIKLCLLENLPNQLILMFQKEFAERLLDKKLNSLNSLVGCFYEINSNFNVVKNCFRPIPKVDSKVLLFKRKEKILLEKNEVSKFINFKRSLFSYKRKTLNNLLKNYNFSKEKFNLSLRIEDITLKELLKIFREINL